MPSLKSLLSQIDPKRPARLELVSGRRPRIVFDDRPGARGDVQNLADEILTDDEVFAFCEAAGCGRKIDALDDGPQSWTHQTGAGAFRVTAELRGREIAAVFAVEPGKQLSQAPKSRSPGHTLKSAQPMQRVSRAKIEASRQSHRPVSPSPGRVIERDVRGRDMERIPVERAPLERMKPVRSPTPAARQAPERAAVERLPPVERVAQPIERNVERAPLPVERTAPSPERLPREPSRRDFERSRSDAPSSKVSTRSRPLLKVAWPQEHGTASRILPVLGDGRRLGASDLHLVPGRPALLRIAGSLAPTRDSFPTAETERAIYALVPLHRRSTFEKRGGADFALDLQKVGRLRVNVTMTLAGVKAAIRFLPRDAPSLESLGLPARLVEATEHHQGLVIVTGPTGHGKTSTLAALVDHLSEHSACHIVSVEDPIEIVHQPKRAIVSQREVGTDTKSFARALSGALRQDPDVIVIGELRDTETVRIALAAAETGHLVIGTMNTPSAAATVEALIDLFPPGEQNQVRATLAGALKYIISQRLVAKTEGTGRAVAVEILPGNLSLWNLIRDQKTFQLKSLMQRGRALGIVELNESLADLVRREVVTKSIAMMASDTPEELAALLASPEPAPLEERPEEGIGGLFQRAGAFFSRGKGGDE